MIIDNARGPVSLPEKAALPPSKLKPEEKGDDAIDFDKMLSESSELRKNEIEKEKHIVGQSEFHIGETKDDKNFREQLEKITGKKIEKSKNKLDQNDYLTLLVTQLKYQDPSKPMEHYEMASQMAQFNTVEQLVGVNKTLKGLSAGQSDKVDKLAQYIEKYVEVEGNHLKLNNDFTTSISRFTLPLKSSATTLEIKDSMGKIVNNIPLGAQEIGTHEVTWNGKDAKGEKVNPGDFTYNILATTDDGKPIVTKMTYLAKVSGVTDISKGGKLETTAGIVDPSKIISVRNHNEEKEKPKILSQDKGVINGVN